MKKIPGNAISMEILRTTNVNNKETKRKVFVLKNEKNVSKISSIFEQIVDISEEEIKFPSSQIPKFVAMLGSSNSLLAFLLSDYSLEPVFSMKLPIYLEVGTSGLT